MDNITLAYANDQPIQLFLKMANRHGLIAGATGTGKTVTLHKLAEEFSKAGINVFMADVKGDLAGIALPNNPTGKIAEILQQHKIALDARKNPTVFWDIYGKQGIPLRTTISEMGPILLGRILQANDVQQGVLNAIFRIADDQGLLLIDMKDLHALLNYVGDNAEQFKNEYGQIASVSVAALQRQLLSLMDAGAEIFFGEPALQLNDLLQVNPANQEGIIHVLDATQLINDSRLYSTFLLWLLSELFEQLPEVGDLDKPKLVFFFDEAHLLFNSAPDFLIEKITQVVRLIRSKGIGIYFITQNPLDIPDCVLGQLGNRVQHALRSFTPADQKAVKAAATTFRANPALNTEEVIANLGVGQALISLLDQDGIPQIVELAQVMPPLSLLGAITSQQRDEVIKQTDIYAKYHQSIDRDSAFERLANRVQTTVPKPVIKPTKAPKETIVKKTSSRQTPTEVFVKSTARALGSKLGQQLVRGILGGLFGGK